MDTFFASLLSLIVLFVSFTLHFLLYKSKSPELGTPLPTGGKGWPIIGESLEFLATGWKGHPEKFIFDRMSKYSPIVFKTSLMFEDFAVLCGAQGNKFLFSNENKLLQIWWPASVQKLLPSTKNKSHKTETAKFRELLPNLLRPEALQRYVPIMDVITQRHFAEEWEGRKEVVTYKLTRNLSFWVACKIFVSIEDPEKVRYLSTPIESIVTGIISIPIDLPGTPFRRGINGANFIRKNLIAIVNQRKVDLDNGSATPTQDILSHMIIFRDEDGKSMEETDIADRILVLLIAGHDPSSSTTAFVVKYLAELPEIYDEVYKEQMEIANSKAPGELLNWEDMSKMKYSWKVACEVLRLTSPLQGSFREAITDFTYNGYSIPKGWKLYWSAGATHKNPEFFPEPEKFDPSRFEGNGPAPYTYVPFGGGPHMCPGQEYARLEILVFMHHLVRKFKWKKMIPDEQIIYNPAPSLAKGLPIRIYPHKA